MDYIAELSAGFNASFLSRNGAEATQLRKVIWSTMASLKIDLVFTGEKAAIRAVPTII